MIPKYIIIHCSATTSGNVDIFRKYHMEHNNWKDVGYQYVICNGNGADDGLVQKGRSDNETGAHTVGYNDKSIGICFVSKNGEITNNQLWALKNLVKKLMTRYNIPAKNVLGHRETASGKKEGKTCPGTLFDMNKFRRELS